MYDLHRIVMTHDLTCAKERSLCVNSHYQHCHEVKANQNNVKLCFLLKAKGRIYILPGEKSLSLLLDVEVNPGFPQILLPRFDGPLEEDFVLKFVVTLRHELKFKLLPSPWGLLHDLRLVTGNSSSNFSGTVFKT